MIRSWDFRVAKVYDSPVLPEAEASFTITEGGVGDEPAS